MSNNCFMTNTEREDIVEIGNNLARYIHNKKIENIIFLDRSARPGYIALKKAWNNRYPNKNPPNIYFTNPEGYNTNNRSIEEIVNEFDNTYKKLSSNKDQRIMIFDTCMHSGNTVKPILDVLKKAGYKNIFLGTAQPKRPSCVQKVHFSALNYRPENGCYPFKRDYIIEKNRISVISSSNKNKGDRESSLELRKEISSLF